MLNKIKLIALAVCAIAVQPTMVTAQGNATGVSISPYVSSQVTSMPAEAAEVLKNKLGQLVTQNGITNGALGTRFIITPNISIMSKDITSTAPPMHALNIDFTFYIGDGINGKKFSAKTISAKGVGTNETKAYIDAIKNISPSDPLLVAFLNEGKQKIVDYYNNNCESIIKTAQAAAGQANYEDAIAQLSGVPDVCNPCFDKAMAAAEPMYAKLIEQQCKVNLTKARAAWNAGQNKQGAADAGELLSKIEPSATCYGDAVALNKEISQRMVEIGNKEWDYKMKVQEGNVEVAKARINAYRNIGMAYYYSRRNVVVYNIAGWW